MPKSANMAFPFMSGKQRKSTDILKNKLSFDKSIKHGNFGLAPTNQDILGFDVSMEHFGLLVV